MIEGTKQDGKVNQCQIRFTLISSEKLLGGIKDGERKKSGGKLQKIKIFLASSAELEEERQILKQLFYDETKKYINKNIFLDLVIWEDIKLAFYGDSRQDYFNEKMLKCDVVIFLFWKKVGDFTKEEFDLAYKNFKEGKKPYYLYVYFKSGKVDIDEIDEEILKIRDLKKEIAEAVQIDNEFKSKEDLILQLKKQLDLTIPEIGS